MAAGLGFKTFTTGEVLTAADTNGYLMQGILVFASAAARDAAITSPQEGQACYLKDTDQVLSYSGSTWVAVGGGSPLTTKGDLYSFSTTDARLAVGANDTVLVADSSEATGLKWAAPAGGGANYSLLNSGGTSLSGTTTTVSGISAKENLIILVTGLKTSTAEGGVNLRINTDSGTNYIHATNFNNAPSTYAAANIGSFTSQTSDTIPFGSTSSNTNSVLSGSAIIRGCNTAGVKVISTIAGSTAAGGNGNAHSSGVTIWNNSATVTSISVLTDYTMNAGTVYVYATA